MLVETDAWNKDYLTTAWFLETINKWFNLMSSRTPVMAISRFHDDKYAETIAFLQSVVELFDNCLIGDQGAWKPVQTGIILSTLSVLRLHDRLIKTGSFKFLLTSRLTQDCLENLFSCVRSKNPVPTPLELKNNLRLLTVAQHLNGSSSGSYEVDDGEFIADFLNGDNLFVAPSLSDDVLDVCEPLVSNAVLNIEFDETDLSCSYYLCGYVLSRVIKNDKTCSECVAAAKSLDYQTEMGSKITKLLSLKEFRAGALVPCGCDVYNVLLTAEKIFRQHESAMLSKNGNMKQMIADEVKLSCCDVKLPECHAIKDKLINRFIGVRLQIFAKKIRSIRKKSTVTKSSGHEMGSKSMQMRKCVSKIQWLDNCTLIFDPCMFVK